MPDMAEGTIVANAPTIVVENNVAALEAALEEARELERQQWYFDQVTRMEAKVARARTDLEGAEASLAAAVAELEAERSRLALEAEQDRAIAAIEADQGGDAPG